MTDIDDVKANVSVLDAAELLELDINRPGVPVHVNCMSVNHQDDTASLALWADHWHCFGCGLSGDVISLVRLALGATHGEAIRWLSSAGVDPLSTATYEAPPQRQPVDLTEVFAREQVDPMRVADDAARLVETKWPNLTPDWLLSHGLGFGRYNLLIPHHDPTGRIVGIKTRSMLPARLGAKSAFPNSTFTTQLYKVETKPRAAVAVLCEGESDCWSMTDAYHADPDVQVYALPSGVACWRDHWATTLNGHHATLLFVDNDTAGDQAAPRIIKELQRAVRFLLPAEFNDCTEAICAGWSVPVL